MKTDYAFPVGLQNIKTEDNVQIPHRFAVVRGDTKKPIGIVSDKYALVPHKEVVEGFRKALKGQETIESIKVSNQGARLYMSIVMPDVKVSIDEGDDVALRLIVENSYDGSKMLQVMFGAYRLVCSNGMVIGKSFVNLSQRHIGSAIGLKIEVIQEQVSLMTDMFKKTAPAMQLMNSTRLSETYSSPEDYFDSKHLHIPSYLSKIANNEYARKDGETVWDAYNATTFAITHHMKKDSPRSSINYGKRVWNAAFALVK